MDSRSDRVQDAFVTHPMNAPAPAPTHVSDPRLGVIAGAGAYLFWGVIAVIYFKQLHHVPPFEIIGYRIVGSVVSLALFLQLTTGFGELSRMLRSPKLLGWLTLTAVLVSINWLIFIYAIGQNKVIECSLGYFITPLFQVALGVVVLREKLRVMQGVAVAIATLSVAVQVFLVGGFPWIALGLASSFSLYALFRKQLNLAAVPALTVECLVLMPVGILLMAWPMRGLFIEGAGVAVHDVPTWVYLALAGAITAIPLVLFGIAARNLRLSTIGFLQYLGPTCQLVLAVFLYHEPLDGMKLFSFVLIWIALVVFSVDAIRKS